MLKKEREFMLPAALLPLDFRCDAPFIVRLAVELFEQQRHQGTKSHKGIMLLCSSSLFNSEQSVQECDATKAQWIDKPLSSKKHPCTTRNL
jgi:hypothetical protein